MSDITVKFRSGPSVTFKGAPDATTQSQVISRVLKQYPDRASDISEIEGAKPSGLAERLKQFATEGNFGEHGVFTSDLPQLLYGALSPLGFNLEGFPQPQTEAEKKSRRMGSELPLALKPMFPSSTGKSMMFRPPIPTGAKAEALRAAAKKAAAESEAADKAQGIIHSPMLRYIAKAAGFGTGVTAAGELINFLKNHL